MLTAQSHAYYHSNLIQLIKKQFSKFGPKRPWNLEFYFLWFRSSPQCHSNTNNHHNSILSSLPSFPHPPPPSQHSLSVFFIESFHDNNFQKYWNRSIEIICNQTISLYLLPSQRQCPAFFNIGSGRVLDKIPGSGSGSGRVGVSKYTIGYFRVSFFLSGISGYVGYFWVYPCIIGLFSNIQWGLKRLQQTKLVLDRSELTRVPRTVLGGTGLWF